MKYSNENYLAAAQISHYTLYFILIAYYKRGAGSVCDDASHVIRSQTECSEALKALNFPASNYWTGYVSTIPSGCSTRNGGDRMPHFEKSSSGKGKGRSDLIPICKGPESSGIVNKFRATILRSVIARLDYKRIRSN